MSAQLHCFRIMVLTVALLSSVTSAMAQGQEMTVILSGGLRQVYTELLPEFEKKTGVKVNTLRGASQGDSENTVGRQLRRGVKADAVIVTKEALVELLAEGKIIPGTDVDLAKGMIGLSVKKGYPKPDISTVEKFKEAMLKAGSISLSPSTGSIYMRNVTFPRLGIDQAIAAKLRIGGISDPKLGLPDIAIRLVSELEDPGIEFVGMLPKDVQYIAVISAGVVTGTTQMENAQKLIAFMASARAHEPMKKVRMEPMPRYTRDWLNTMVP